MARLDFTDVRGRGGGNDSSSSRESSPQPTRRRIPSPNYDDDGDIDVPPIADDDTPPPEQRPFIRQAVGFTQSVSAPPNVDTYEARPITTSSEKPTFLPGQEVAQPPAPKKKGPRSKKTKQSDKFPNQMGRFRLDSYDPSAGPSTMPPLKSGTGPYSSIYRASTTPFNPQDPVTPVNPTMPPAPPKKSRGKPNSPHPFTQPATFSVNPPVSPAQSPNAALQSGAENRGVPGLSGPPGHHYRRDYDKDPFGIGHLGAGNRRGSSDGTVSSSHASPPPTPYNYPAPNSQASSSADPAKRVPSRMVTILIIDVRSGTPDHQLAEVKIPLKTADNPEDGFWADAKDLCAKLQEGPSRIDGPAKVYTMRGRYRQFFLRVSEDNRDETMQANLSVTPDRTIEVVVEVGQRPGEIPAPPQIPRELRTPSPEIDLVDARPNRYGNQIIDPIEYNKKRRHSPGGNYYDGHPPPPPPGPRASGSGYPANPYSTTYPANASQYPPPFGPNTYHPGVGLGHPPPPKKMRSNELEPPQMSTSPPQPPPAPPKMAGPPPNWRRRDPLQASPEPEDEEDIVQKKVVKRVDQMIQKEKDWMEWFKHRGQPQCVSIVLVLYRFAQHLFEAYEGKRVAFNTQSLDIKITRVDILAALQMKEAEEREKFASDCSETLRLLAFYGPEGSRLQDSRVKEMMEDKTPPEYNAKPIKRFLRLLREVDEEWAKVNSSEGMDTSAE